MSLVYGASVLVKLLFYIEMAVVVANICPLIIHGFYVLVKVKGGTVIVIPWAWRRRFFYLHLGIETHFIRIKRRFFLWINRFHCEFVEEAFVVIVPRPNFTRCRLLYMRLKVSCGFADECHYFIIK